MLSKLYLAACSLAIATGAAASPMTLRLAGSIEISDVPAVAFGSRYEMTLAFDSLAADYSSEPGRGLYGGVDALISGFDLQIRTPGGDSVSASQQALGSTGSNSLISVIDDPRGDAWYLNLFGRGLSLSGSQAYLPDYRISVELGGGTDGVTSKSLASVPRAASFETALLGFFYGDGSPLLIGTIDSISAVTAVPEPATWLTMLLGLGGVAAIATRRRPQPVTRATTAS